MNSRAWNNIWAITKREVVGFFASPVAYVFIIIFLLLAGFFTFMVSGFFQRGEANLGSFFMWLPWLYLFLVPAVAMRMWSEERRLGTIELLFTMPLTAWQAIIGKFLAAWFVVAVALLLTFPLVVTVNYLGHPDNGIIFAGYAGSLLLAGSYLAVGAMMSALTRNQVVSFILAVVVCLFLVLAGWPPITGMLGQYAAPWLVDMVASFSVMTHFQGILKGVLDSRDLLFFSSIILFSLFTTSVILRTHRAG